MRLPSARATHGGPFLGALHSLKRPQDGIFQTGLLRLSTGIGPAGAG